MKRVFLIGALSLTALGALAALLAVQAQDSTRANHSVSEAGKPSIGAEKSPVMAADTAVEPSTVVSGLRKKPGYDPDKSPWKPGDMMMKEARELFRAGDVEGAERKCRAALQFFRSTYLANSPKELLGDIQVAKGQYKEALESYGVARSHSANPGLSLNVALCFIRLGDYENAKKSYSDRYMLRFTGVRKEDLPGTDTPRALEASILLARGAEAKTSGDYKGALANYEPASKLSPRNGKLAYNQAMVLMDLKRYDEALPMFARAIRFGNSAQIKSAKSTMIQRWPRAQAEKAISEAAKIP